MSAIQIINAVLNEIEDLKAIVEERIYPGDAPQMIEGSYIITNLTSGNDTPLINGAGKYYRDRVTIDMCAEKFTAVSKMGNILRDRLVDVIKQSIDEFHDVDIHFAGVDFTQPNDARTAYMRTQQFFVQWRS